jgi:hypothetical protein
MHPRHSITRALSKIGELLPRGWSSAHFRDHTDGTVSAMDNKEHPEIAPRPRVLTEVKQGECRYIVGDETFPALCCAAPARPGKSWCEDHCKVVYRLSRN